jgi:response regulator RpfG family c-di-GMP phosphodiesterase
MVSGYFMGKLFAEEKKEKKMDQNLSPWKVLVVDDDEHIFTITKLTMSNFEFSGRKLEFLYAPSGRDARPLIKENPDIAMAIIDVIMETESAGLDLVKWIREEQNDQLIRLILRTGQPGQAPEEKVIRGYDINDYKEKTELTSKKLKTLFYSTLRAYRDILTLDRHRSGLSKVIASTGKVLESNSLPQFASVVLEEIISLLGFERSAIYCATVPSEDGDQKLARTLAATGELVEYLESNDFSLLPEQVRLRFKETINAKKSQEYTDAFVAYFKTDRGHENVLYVEIPRPLGQLEKELLRLFTTNMALSYEGLLSKEELMDTQKELVYILGDSVEKKSKETGAHVKRVGLYAELLAQKMGRSPEYCSLLKFAAPLHDVGKVAIPDAILGKPGELEPSEWVTMKTHAVIGHQILSHSQKPILKAAAEIALTHHENWDGTGYPKGTDGVSISELGRIVAFADVFDALASPRVYKGAWGKEVIRKHFEKLKGKKFDPEMSAIFLDSFDEFWEIFESNPD